MCALPVVKSVPLCLDRQASPDDVAFCAQVCVPCAPGIATRVEAERIFRADVVMLIFEAEQHVDQRALVDHVVEAAAGIPAGVARRAVHVSATKCVLVAETGD